MISSCGVVSIITKPRESEDSLDESSTLGTTSKIIVLPEQVEELLMPRMIIAS